MLKDVVAGLLGRMMILRIHVDGGWDWAIGVLRSEAVDLRPVTLELLTPEKATSTRVEQIVAEALHRDLWSYLAGRGIIADKVAAAVATIVFDPPGSDGLSRAVITLQIRDDHGYTYRSGAEDVARGHLEHRRRQGR